MLSEHNKQHHRKLLLSDFHPNCPHFIGKKFIQRLSGGVGGGGGEVEELPFIGSCFHQRTLLRNMKVCMGNKKILVAIQRNLE